MEQMEAEWQADRSFLRELIQSRPDLSLKQMAIRVGRSYSWVKKWARRLATAPPDDLAILRSYSRMRKTPPPDWDEARSCVASNTSVSFPQRACSAPLAQNPSSIICRSVDEILKRDCPLPRSTRTIWKLLKHLGLLEARAPIKHRQEPLREPLAEVQVDFKDVSTVRPDPSGEGKKQHVVEVCNAGGCGNLHLALRPGS